MNIKQLIAKKTLEKLDSNNILGLGTGTTVEALIEVLAEEEYTFQNYVFSSLRTKSFAMRHGLKGQMLHEAAAIDIYVDGTDEIDSDFVALKGAGGAMTGEMLCARMAKSFWILATKQKKVTKLGQTMPLPVEIVSWGQSQFARYVVSIGGRPVLRPSKSELGNAIIDCHGLSMAEPYTLAKKIESFPGVISHGLFVCYRPDTVVLGDATGCEFIANNNKLGTQSN